MDPLLILPPQPSHDIEKGGRSGKIGLQKSKAKSQRNFVVIHVSYEIRFNPKSYEIARDEQLIVDATLDHAGTKKHIRKPTVDASLVNNTESEYNRLIAMTFERISMEFA
jgi:hypothetical protein